MCKTVSPTVPEKMFVKYLCLLLLLFYMLILYTHSHTLEGAENISSRNISKISFSMTTDFEK